MNQKNKLYKDSGVDIEKGDKLVDWLKSSEEVGGVGGKVVSGIGGFSGLFAPNFTGMKKPLLVAATDGVGTKLLLGLKSGKLQGLGIDLVGMCVNDLYTIGATPLFFLDYYATGSLDEGQFKEVLSGIYEGLKQAKTSMLGGETAELPGLYSKGHFDLAGFVVGVVDNEKKVQPETIKPNDVLIGLKSTGFHSNGYSLIRKWIGESSLEGELRDLLLSPTKIYSGLPEIVGKFGSQVRGMAHITGGGISGNLIRILPNDVTAEVQFDRIETPTWMSQFIKDNGATFSEVEPVFNLGMGMILAVDPVVADQVLEDCRKLDMPGSIIGSIKKGGGEPQINITGLNDGK